MHNFGPDKRLRRREEFEATRKEGVTHHSTHFRLNVLASTGLETSRLGIITGKRLGGAVERVRMRRLIREFYRTSQILFCGSFDLVVVPKPEATQCSPKALREELLRLWKRAGIILTPIV